MFVLLLHESETVLHVVRQFSPDGAGIPADRDVHNVTFVVRQQWGLRSEAVQVVFAEAA